MRWLRPDYQVPRFGKEIDKMAAEEAQLVAPLELLETKVRKTAFPTDAVEQTAAVFAALAEARGPIRATDISARYRTTKNLDKTISELLSSLERLGHVSTRDGQSYQIRRSA